MNDIVAVKKKVPHFRFYFTVTIHNHHSVIIISHLNTIITDS